MHQFNPFSKNLVIGIDAYNHGVPLLTTVINNATRLTEVLCAALDYETILLTEKGTGQ